MHKPGLSIQPKLDIRTCYLSMVRQINYADRPLVHYAIGKYMNIRYIASINEYIAYRESLLHMECRGQQKLILPCSFQLK